MAERLLGAGLAGILIHRLTNGQYTGSVSASLFPTDLEGPGHELMIAKEATLSLEHTTTPNGMLSITGVIIRFTEVLL